MTDEALVSLVQALMGCWMSAAVIGGSTYMVLKALHDKRMSGELVAAILAVILCSALIIFLITRFVKGS